MEKKQLLFSLGWAVAKFVEHGIHIWHAAELVSHFVYGSPVTAGEVVVEMFFLALPAVKSYINK